MDRVSLERLLEQGLSLAEIGRRLGRHESTVGYWVANHGLEARGRRRHQARGALDRTELERLVDAGATIAEIAEQADRSKATVRHWLRSYGLRTTNGAGRRRSRGSRSAQEAGLDRPSMECSSHGEVVHALDSRGYYRCTRCRSAAVSRRRRTIKERWCGRWEGHVGSAATRDVSRRSSSITSTRLRSPLRSASTAYHGRWSGLERRRGSACCCARTATPRSRPA
jgi:transposase